MTTNDAPRPSLSPAPPLDETRANREYWDAYADEYQRTHRCVLDRSRGWGTFAIPEDDVAALGDVADLDVLEYGCGAAQWSVALAAAGARPVGLDASGGQLAHAARRRLRHRLALPLVQAAAEAVPFRDARFDLVFCDHGAMSYADPRRTLPEVARLLRPRGRLVFSQYTPLVAMCWNEAGGAPEAQLHTSAFTLGRWQDESGFVSWDLPHGEWIRLFRAHGFVVDDLIELVPPPGARSTHHDAATIAWARRWPLEQIWCTRLE